MSRAIFIFLPLITDIYYKQYVSHSMGHISRRADVYMNMDQSAWKTDLTNIIDRMEITNVVQVKTLWENTTEDENFIQQQLNVTQDLLDKVTLTPKQSTGWHFSGTFVDVLQSGQCLC